MYIRSKWYCLSCLLVMICLCDGTAQQEQNFIIILLPATGIVCKRNDVKSSLSDALCVFELQYCRRKVLPVYRDAQQVNLIALTNVLQVPLRVVNIDVTLIEKPNIHIFNESPDSSVPTVTLLYRPGHYDIIYEKSQLQIVVADII